MSRGLRVEHPGQLADVLPHLLGFAPSESLVVVPLTPGLPVARIDLPDQGGITARALSAYADTILPPYARYSTRQSEVALVVISERRPLAEHVASHVAHKLSTAATVSVKMRVWSDGVTWHEGISDTTGRHTIEDATRYAAERAFAGARLPTQSRAALNESLTGDRTALASDLEQVKLDAGDRSPGSTSGWAVDRVCRFHADGVQLDGPDAARLLLAVGDKPIRDQLWLDIGPTTATSHQSLWTDLVRRAPDEVRTPAAALLGFASWQQGDGATAWCALDQIPVGERDGYVLADLVAAALTDGLHPSEWGALQAVLVANPTDGALDTASNPPRLATTPRDANPPHGRRDPSNSSPER